MTPFEKLDRFLRNLYETAFYFAVMAVKENFRNYVGRAGTPGTPARDDGHPGQRPLACRGAAGAAP